MQPAAAFHIPTLPRVPRARRAASTPSRAVTCSAAARKQSRLAPSVRNKMATFRFELLEKFECGVELVGTEIKSIRSGNVQLRDAYARVTNGELFLHNVHIAPYEHATAYFNHDPVRTRRLLLHKRTIRQLQRKQTDAGLTLVPTRAYFSDRGYWKVEIALARGKKLHDKRQDLKNRDTDRELRRVVKNSMAP